MILDKAKLAHDHYMKFGDVENFKVSILEAWEYADLMFEQEEKRKDNGVPEVLKQCNSTELEWQPDWSQAPKHMNYFAMNKSGVKLWHVNKPELSLTEWIIDFSNCGGDCYSFASKQDYQGDWRNSFRKRPQ